MRQVNWSLLVNTVGVVLLIPGLYFTAMQIEDLRRVNAGQISLDINRDIYSPERYPDNPAIIKLINAGSPILKENGGRYSDEDLDNLLGEWDLVAKLNQLKILPDDLVYNEFSFDVEQAYKNKEIQAYINRIREQYSESSFYEDFEQLALWMISQDVVI